jgi:quercetin dioxygenase-like cupin family protein
MDFKETTMPTMLEHITFVPSGRGRVLQVLGERITCKAVGEDTGGAYAVIEEVSQPQCGPPMHLHNREDEALYVLDGEYEVQIGNHRMMAAPGSFVLLPRGISHSFRNVAARPGRVLVVITPAGFETFFEDVDRIWADRPPDIERLKSIAARYGLEFVATDGH